MKSVLRNYDNHVPNKSGLSETVLINFDPTIPLLENFPVDNPACMAMGEKKDWKNANAYHYGPI